MIVYKYYPLNSYTKHALINNYFFFSKVARLNDPFDASFKLIESSQLAKKLIAQRIISPHSKEIMKGYGTCSFSEKKDSMHMWAFYANNFNGIVVGYEDATFGDISARLLARVDYYQVNYIDHILNVDNSNESFTIQDFIRGPKIIRLGECFHGDSKKDDAFFAYLCTVKAKSPWIEEHERRLVVAGDIIKDKKRLEPKGVQYLENGYKIPMPENAVKEIYIGHNIAPNEYKCLKAITEKYNINDVYQTFAENPFSIDFKPVKL